MHVQSKQIMCLRLAHVLNDFTTAARRHKRVNPALLAVSGYVFCYPCLFNWVAEEGCCPVTRFPAGIDHIRKLYEAT